MSRIHLNTLIHVISNIRMRAEVDLATIYKTADSLPAGEDNSLDEWITKAYELERYIRQVNQFRDTVFKGIEHFGGDHSICPPEWVQNTKQYKIVVMD